MLAPREFKFAMRIQLFQERLSSEGGDVNKLGGMASVAQSSEQTPFRKE